MKKFWCSKSSISKWRPKWIAYSYRIIQLTWVKLQQTWLNTVSVVQSASTGLNRSHTVTPPYLYRHLPAATGKIWGYAGSPPWHTVATVDTALVCYGFTRRSYGGDTVDAGRATVMPRNKPALFRIPVSHGCLKKLKPPGPLPGEHWFNTVYLDSMRCLLALLRCGPGMPRCPHRSDAGTEIRDSVNEA